MGGPDLTLGGFVIAKSKSEIRNLFPQRCTRSEKIDKIASFKKGLFLLQSRDEVRQQVGKPVEEKPNRLRYRRQGKVMMMSNTVMDWMETTDLIFGADSKLVRIDTYSVISN